MRRDPAGEAWLARGDGLRGFARPWFNLPEVKAELGIPDEFAIVMPLVVGWPAVVPPPPPRHEPNIICWIDDHRAP